MAPLPLRPDAPTLTSRIAALVLAAGQGRRFGTDDRTTKAVASLRGIPLVRTVVMTALASRAASVSVVTGHAHAEVEAALDGLEVVLIPNSAHETGMASSLKAGLATMAADVDGVVVMLADMPLVQTGTVDRLMTHFDVRTSTIDAVVPVYDGRRGNPVLIGRRLFAAVERLTGDEGARSLLRKPELTVEFCDVDDPGVLIDIDTQAELMALNQSS